MGLFGKIGKLVGGGIKKLAGPALSVIPGAGVVGAIGSKVVGRLGRAETKKAVGAAAVGAVAGAGIMSGMGGGLFRQHAMGTRRRRINPGNVKAMRRAVSRVTQGAKLYRKMFNITHGHIKGAPGVRVRRGKR